MEFYGIDVVSYVYSWNLLESKSSDIKLTMQFLQDYSSHGKSENKNFKNNERIQDNTSRHTHDLKF